MFNQKHGGVSALLVCLILFSPLISLAQNEGAFDPAEGLDFEVVKTHVGDVLDIKVADMDGDRNMDIIYSGLFDKYLHIMYGKGKGEFEPPTVYPYKVEIKTIGHLNNDIYPEIISPWMYWFSIFINNGDRTFTKDSLSQEYTNLDCAAFGYFNNDSYIDIVAPKRFIYYGNGAGGFSSIDTLPFSFQTVYVSDFNNDYADDIIAIDHRGRSDIYLNDNDGNFTKSAHFDLGGNTLGVSIDNPFADFNRDGNADFAFITPIGNQPVSSKITIGYGDGNGGITDYSYKMVPKTAYCLSIADVDRDNNLDLIAANASDAMMEVFLGSEEGLFSEAFVVDLKTDSIVHAITTGDLDRDGNPDFAAGAFWADSIILIMNRKPAAPVLSEPMITTGFSNVSLAIVNPTGFELSQNYKTVAGATYRRQDIDLDETIDERAIDYNLQYGEYKITIDPRPDASPESKFSTTINIGPDEMILFKDYNIQENSKGEPEPIVFYYTVEEFSSIQPANGSTIEADQPLFDWSGLIENNSEDLIYNFQLDRYYDFRSPIVDIDDLESSQYIPSTPLAGEIVYYWRFRTIPASIGSAWSDYSRTFAVLFKSPTDMNNGAPHRQLPDNLILSQNHPNPFNPTTEISFTLPRACHARLDIYNIVGKRVTTLVEEYLGSGEHTVVWNGVGSDNMKVSSGLYFYRLSTDDFAVSKKMLLLK